jgi:hypothetical protein
METKKKTEFEVGDYIMIPACKMVCGKDFYSEIQEIDDKFFRIKGIAWISKEQFSQAKGRLVSKEEWVLYGT